jgi:hypothetical protein
MIVFISINNNCSVFAAMRGMGGPKLTLTKFIYRASAPLPNILDLVAPMDERERERESDVTKTIAW